MPLTTIDPRTALVVIDLQKGIVSTPVAHPIEDVVRRSAELANAFRRHGLPVILVTVTGGAPGRTDVRQSRPAPAPDWADLIDELEARPDEHRVVKTRWGAFTGTTLHAHLQELGVTQVVITGVATSAGVESTARSAHELGYHVVVATDAMTDRSIEAHQHSVERIFPRIGETTTAGEIIAMLDAERTVSGRRC